MPEIELILTAKGGEQIKTTIGEIQNKLASARQELESFIKDQKKGFSDTTEAEAFDKNACTGLPE